jgi:hypothetical protein
MRIAITFGDQSEYERRSNEYCYSPLSTREAESLPQFVQLETPAVFNHEFGGNFVCGYSCLPGCEADDFSGDCSFCRRWSKTER